MDKQQLLKEYRKQEDKMCLSQILDKIEFSDFLDMYQVALVENFFRKIKFENYKLYGGYEEAERKENTEVAETTEEPTQTSSVTGTDVASYAKQYLGYKYVSGGATPSVGFDCSGFTYYVYKHFGITLSRTSSAQASNGRAVNKDNLQAGDLIIFNNSSNSAIGHVGIYIGGNNFIHAANATKGVITTSVSNSYYQARYVSARRIIY